jgi:hypothetical protein
MYSAFEWRVESPGHDELRCVLFLINGTVWKTICGSRLRARRWELFVRLSYPVQTLVGTLNNHRRGAVKWERDLRFQAERAFSAPAQAAVALVGERHWSPLDRTAQATRASTGARRSALKSVEPGTERRSFSRSPVSIFHAGLVLRQTFEEPAKAYWPLMAPRLDPRPISAIAK